VSEPGAILAVEARRADRVELALLDGRRNDAIAVRARREMRDALAAVLARFEAEHGPLPPEKEALAALYAKTSRRSPSPLSPKRTHL
jgi:hypothetical protein